MAAATRLTQHTSTMNGGRPWPASRRRQVARRPNLVVLGGEVLENSRASLARNFPVETRPRRPCRLPLLARSPVPTRTATLRGPIVTATTRTPPITLEMLHPRPPGHEHLFLRPRLCHSSTKKLRYVSQYTESSMGPSPLPFPCSPVELAPIISRPEPCISRNRTPYCKPYFISPQVAPSQSLCYIRPGKREPAGPGALHCTALHCNFSNPLAERSSSTSTLNSFPFPLSRLVIAYPAQHSFASPPPPRPIN